MSGVRRCPVCEHASVLGINQAILNGKSYRAIARDYRIGSEASGEFKPDHKKVMRHAEGCMQTSFQEVQETNLSAQGKAIQARLQELEEHVNTAIQDALEGEVLMLGDTPMLNDDGTEKRVRSIAHIRALLAAVREGRQNQALIAKLAGALPDGDEDPAAVSRKALENPAVRKLVQQMEELLAREATEAGADGVQT